MNFKYLLAFQIFFLFSCKTPQEFNYSLLKERINGEKRGIIISCFKCDCMLSSLKSNSNYVQGIKLFADTLCVPKVDSLQVSNLSQSTLDSVFEKNYSIILFKFTSESEFEYRLVKTEESLQLNSILRQFFR